MNITILGGAGFLGSKLSQLLLEEDHKVKVIDTFSWGIESILSLIHYKNFSCIKQDIRDPNLNLEDADVIVLLAAVVGYPSCDRHPDLAWDVNVNGTQNVVNKSLGKKIIFASTGSVYGELNQICTEEITPNPISLYSETKLKGEEIISQIGGVSLRPATAFGVSNRLRTDLLVNDFVKIILKENKLTLFEGHFKRTFLSAYDLARGFKFAIDNYNTLKGKAWNLGDERLNYTKLEIAQIIKTKIDYELIISNLKHDQDGRNYFVDYSKIKNLGYKSTETIQQSILDLIKVYKCMM